MVQPLVERHNLLARPAHEQAFQRIRIALRLRDERPELIDRHRLGQRTHTPHHSLGWALRPLPVASLLRPAGSGSPFRPAIRLFAAISAILPRVAALALAMCGTTMQLGSDTSG